MKYIIMACLYFEEIRTEKDTTVDVIANSAHESFSFAPPVGRKSSS